MAEGVESAFLSTINSQPSTSAAAKPLFVPLLDNGNGSVMASFMMDHSAAFGGREVHMVRASDSHANRGMNKIANSFLDSPCDVWINIDADIRFRKMDIDNLLSHDLPLVYGIYPKKEESAPPCLCTFADLPQPDPVTGLAEVRRCGRGFMLVKREVLEAMKEDNGGPALRYHNHDKVEWDFFPSGPVTGAFSALECGAAAPLSVAENTEHRTSNIEHRTGNGSDSSLVTRHSSLDPDGFPIREWISEDWYFCERARTLGYRTFVDTRIALGHVGTKEYRFGPDQVARFDGWHGIEGWFTNADAEVYRQIVAAIPVDGSVAEIGTWLGRSLGALVEFCRDAGKTPLIHAIDTFKGTLSEGAVHTDIVAAHGGSIRSAFEDNMKNLGAERLIVHEAESLAASKDFDDASLDALFIDGDHTYEAVSEDIEAWLPKVKKGGIIAGHDYDYPQVAGAVYMHFGNQAEKVGRCWLVRL
jgi:Methyltransferase domain